MTGIPHDYHDFKKEASYSHGFISLQKTTWKAFDLKSPQSVRSLEHGFNRRCETAHRDWRPGTCGWIETNPWSIGCHKWENNQQPNMTCFCLDWIMFF